MNKISSLLSAILLSVTVIRINFIIGGSGWLQFAILPAAAGELALDRVKQLQEDGLIVPLSTILRDAKQRYQFGHLVEAGLHRSGDTFVYEIEFLDGNDELRELYYDAKTGRLLFYEIHVTGSDGMLRSIRYDATSDKPLSYGFEVPDGSGRERRKYEYNLEIQQLLPHAEEKEDRRDALTAD
jgi:uncharacterized membrane protein YkoI